MQSLLWPEIPGLFTSNFGVAAFDLHMPLDRHVSCTTERAFLRWPAVAHACPHEGPLASLSRLEVFLRDPTARLLRMPPCGPGPQRLKDRCVHFEEDRL